MNQKLLIFVFILSLSSVIAQERIALMVGIGSYPTESKWSVIHGDKDIELLLPLVKKCGFKAHNIITILNDNATKDSIISAISKIESKAKIGDIIYIHFSGHGQLVTDTNGDEPDGWDESIVPYDAIYEYSDNYRGENHIIDDQLNYMLSRIHSRIGNSGMLLVTLDACHSGDGTRHEDSDDNLYIRGAGDKFIITENRNTTEQYQPSPTNWITISACKSYQSNYEYKVGNRYLGRLSYALSQCLKPQIGILEFLDNLNQIYSIIPLYRDIPQSLDIDIPNTMETKTLF